MRHSSRFLAATLAVAMMATGNAFVNADVVYSGGTYTQDFDTLISTGTNQTWTNDSTLTGWSLFQSAGSAITTYNSGTGSSTAGNFYSFGAAANTERSLGGVGSGAAYFGSPGTGSVAGHIAVQITNNTGFSIDSFTIGYDGEQWRNGGNTTAQTMGLQYGFGSTFGGVSSWTSPGGNFDWTSVVNTATGAAVDGNTTGLVAGRGGTIGSLAWNNGDSLWIRWIEVNDAGSDHGLGIDNFSFSGTAIPEPATAGVASLVAFGMTCLRRRRQA